MANLKLQSDLKSHLESAWSQSLSRIASIHTDASLRHDSSASNPLENLVAIGRAWNIVQSHYTDLATVSTHGSGGASSGTPNNVVEALRFLSQAGQAAAVSAWYLSLLEKHLPSRLQILLEPLSNSFQSTSTSRGSSIHVVCQSIVSDLKETLSPVDQRLFGTPRDKANLIRTYQAILHSQLSQTPTFQSTLLKTLSRGFYFGSDSHGGAETAGVETQRLVSNLVLLGLGSFLKMKLNAISNSKIQSKVVSVADDGTWKLNHVPPNKKCCAEDLEGKDDGEIEEGEEQETIGTSGSTIPLLKEWLNIVLVPSFRKWIDFISKLERETRMENPGFESDLGMDLDLEHQPASTEVAESESSQEQIIKGLEYRMLKLVCEVRTLQLFDLAADWPESKPALLDLKECLLHSELRISVTKAYSQALKTRLLHHGAGTQDIIQIYVHMIRCFREIDPSGVILSLVVSPIRTYLKGRKDTISVIVSGLIGQGESTLLRQELEKPFLQHEISTVGILESRENVSKSAGIRSSENEEDGDYDSDYDEEEEVVADDGEFRRPDWQDEDWSPRPIDAGPNYNQSKNADIINILITIFDDRVGFIKALEQTTAESLLKVKFYDSDREYRNNMILKRRFGTDAIGHCDVMLSDITMSRRIDTSILHLTSSALKQHGTSAPPLDFPHPSALSLEEVVTLSNLKPLILSKQFWPEFQSQASISTDSPPNNLNGEKGEVAKLGSGLDFGSGAGTENLKMPGQFDRVMKVYENFYSNVKDTRKLKWLTNVGKLRLELEMRDGRILDETVTPLQAAVIELASGGKKTRLDPINDSSVSQILAVEKTSALNALYFWSSKGVLKELEDAPGCFKVVEYENPDEEESEEEEEEDEEMDDARHRRSFDGR